MFCYSNEKQTNTQACLEEVSLNVNYYNSLGNHAHGLTVRFLGRQTAVWTLELPLTGCMSLSKLLCSILVCKMKSLYQPHLTALLGAVHEVKYEERPCDDSY